MFVNDKINVIDNAIPHDLRNELTELARRPIWGYGWRSNTNHDRYCFWHAHFAGGDGKSRKNCLPELKNNLAASPVHALWEILSKDQLRGHIPLRVYANAHTYGVEGHIHADSTDEENYFTTIYYAHDIWRKNWAGDITFYSDDDEVIKSISPQPGRIVLFPGSILHKAQAPSRECPELRVSIVIKTQLA
ncbi:2OG-Fe(II) oxygenase [Massilia sp. Root335]|uniref:2OG-Fe(II) oxygenase n=1 Tax=Massilia sp. Root335 TaxID=1736517 RepID=UPI0012F6FA64|nr:2OG-Fe(II) oxygenase [Massilia sp. Root335]